ncbi:MAG TPA: DUF4831 family protein, partial [Bacteroidales bacterium]|nr:DUF4831 family protein [Bacteroidales bacterium]
ERNKGEKAKGLYYRIPEKADVTVTIGGQPRVDGSFTVSQLGTVTFLPAGTSGNIELYPGTGSVKHITLR